MSEYKKLVWLALLSGFIHATVSSKGFADEKAIKSSDTQKENASSEYPEYRFNHKVPMLESVEFVPEEPWLWLENDEVKLGLNLEYGGSVCWLSRAGSDFNLVNWYDPGRQVQFSVFGNDGFPQEVYGGPGPEGKMAFTVWNWNPVQAGDARGNKSPVVGYGKKGNTAWARCQPLNWGGMASAVSLKGKWDPGPCPAEAFIDVKASLDGPVVKLTFGFVYWGQESHGDCKLEMPAVYLTAPLDRFWTYTGEQPWTYDSAEDMSNQVPLDMTRQQFHHQNLEGWGAWLTKEGWGVTVYQPDATKFSAGTYYPNGQPDFAAKPRDASWGQVTENHYLAGWCKRPVDQWNCRYEWDLYLIVGELDKARQIITEQLRNSPRMRSSAPAPTNEKGPSSKLQGVSTAKKQG